MSIHQSQEIIFTRAVIREADFIVAKRLHPDNGSLVEDRVGLQSKDVEQLGRSGPTEAVEFLHILEYVGVFDRLRDRGSDFFRRLAVQNDFIDILLGAAARLSRPESVVGHQSANVEIISPSRSRRLHSFPLHSSLSP